MKLKIPLNIIFTALVIAVSLILASSAGQAQGLDVGKKVTGGVLPNLAGGRTDLGKVFGAQPTVIWICDLSPVAESGVDNLHDLQTKFSKNKVAFFIISTGEKKETTGFFQKNPIGVPILLGGDDPVTGSLMGGSDSASPTSNFFLIDRQGNLRFKGYLPGMTTGTMEKEITDAL